MQTLKEISKKPISSLSLTNENIVTEGTNLRPVKDVHRNERVLSYSQIYQRYHEFQ